MHDENPLPPQSASAFDAEANPGVWVARQCAELGISISRVAKEARVNPSSIFRWQQGKCGPNLDTFKRVKYVIDGYWQRQESYDRFRHWESKKNGV